MFVLWACLACNSSVPSTPRSAPSSESTVPTTPVGARAFWAWFAAHDETYRDPGEIDAAELKAVTDELQKVEPGLVAEFAQTPGGATAILISADGLRERIPAVREVVRTAPALLAWKVVAFRQPDATPLTLDIGGIKLDVAEARAVTDGAPSHADVELYLPLPSTTPRDTVSSLGFLALDHGLGEYVVMTQLGAIHTQAGPAPEGAKSLAELRDWLKAGAASAP